METKKKKNENKKMTDALFEQKFSFTLIKINLMDFLSGEVKLLKSLNRNLLNWVLSKYTD